MVQPVIVGASLSLSGRFAPQGQQAHGGLTLWAEHVNRDGGLRVGPGEPRRPVHPLILDDTSRRAEAAANTRRLIERERTDLLLGPYGSVLALTAAEVAAEYNRTLWNHGGSSDVMAGRGWRHVVNLLSPASSYFVPLLDLAVQAADRPVRRVALLRGAGGTFPVAVIGGAREHAGRLGLEIVFDGTYPEQPDALGSLVSQVAERAPDVILGAGTMEADIAFARAIRAQEVAVPMVGLVAAAVQPFRQALGADADGFLGPSQWEPTLRDRPEIGPTSAQFAAAFRERWGLEPDYPAAQAYAAGLIAGRCVEQAGTLNHLATREVAARLDTATFFGRFRTNPVTGQQVGHTVVVVRWQAGRKAIAWPLEPTTPGV